MKTKQYILTLISIILLSFQTQAQLDKELDSLKIAEAFIESENFEYAVGFYRNFLNMDPDDPEINFKLGFSLLNTPSGKQECLQYLEKAAKIYKRKRGKNSTSYIEVYFYLARAYRAVYRFDEAMAMLADLQTKIRNRRFRVEIESEFILCESGKYLYNNPVNAKLELFGEPINSVFSDHSPVISADESVIIFTSRRENASGGEPDMDGSYSEDIFITEKIDGSWTEPRSISSNINTADHEASISLSLDGQTLLLYRGEDEGSIYISRRNGSDWTVPEKLGETINTTSRETSASLSADERLLYFTSDRSGGFGGLDIYVSEIQPDGSWGEPKNLGPAVNTEFDEEGPYIHPDGKSLYFSSKGHFNMGGFDIFKVERNEFGTWTLPKNVGFPINTIEDDVFYVPSPDSKRIYLSSYRVDGLGKSDIYLINSDETPKAEISVLSGKVYAECTQIAKPVNVTLIDVNSGYETYYTPNEFSGTFVFVAQKERPYVLRASVGGKLVYSDSILLNKFASYKIQYDSIRLDPFTDCNAVAVRSDTTKNAVNTENTASALAQTLFIGNVLFGYAADNYKPTADVDSLISFLVLNSETKILIKAYADASGAALENYSLSINRGNAVKEYFKTRGVKDSQLEVNGYGEENPIARNYNSGLSDSESQKYNRRVEFEVISQSKTVLKIVEKPNIPKNILNPSYKKDYQKIKRNDIEIKV